jgi:hypothetical protein
VATSRFRSKWRHCHHPSSRSSRCDICFGDLRPGTVVQGHKGGCVYPCQLRWKGGKDKTLDISDEMILTGRHRNRIPPYIFVRLHGGGIPLPSSHDETLHAGQDWHLRIQDPIQDPIQDLEIWNCMHVRRRNSDRVLGSLSVHAVNPPCTRTSRIAPCPETPRFTPDRPISLGSKEPHVPPS